MSGRRRLAQAMIKPSRSQLGVGVLLAVVGFAAVTQVRSNEQDDTYAGAREQDLVDVLSALSGASQRTRSEIERLEQSKIDLEADTSNSRAALKQAQEQADALRILAGTVPVTGPGLRVTITDPNGTVDLDILLDTIQELRTAGAEAMEINGEVRLVAQTALEDGVGGVIIDGKTITAPYIIDVIGEPHTLEGALTFPDGPMASVEEDGGQLVSEEVDKLDIDSVAEQRDTEHADPDEPE